MSLMTQPDLAEQVRAEDAIEGCLFSPSGRLLWSAVHTSSDTAALEIRETKSCEVVACAEVPDPFESSGLMLFSHPSEDRVALWVAAGQDGQCLYWGRYDGSKLEVQRFPDLTDTAPQVLVVLANAFLSSPAAACGSTGIPMDRSLAE